MNVYKQALDLPVESTDQLYIPNYIKPDILLNLRHTFYCACKK